MSGGSKETKAPAGVVAGSPTRPENATGKGEAGFPDASCAAGDIIYGFGHVGKQGVAYSPTRTEDFLRCPVYHRLRRDGWEALGTGWEPPRAMGTAIAKGLEVFYLNQGDPFEAARLSLDLAYQDNPKHTLDGLQAILAKGLTRALERAEEIVQAEHVLGVELDLGESRPDLVTRSKSTGELIVTDAKAPFHLKPEWVPKRLAEYDSSHQFRHYAWRVGLHYGEPVKWVRAHLTILTPTAKSLVHPVKVTPEWVEFWLRGAKYVWGHMQECEGVPLKELPPKIDSCHGKFGRCPMYEACHVYHLDEDQFGMLYEKQEKGVIES